MSVILVLNSDSQNQYFLTTSIDLLEVAELYLITGKKTLIRGQICQNLAGKGRF